MKIKTAEATGLQLDWGVAVVLGAKDIHFDHRGVWVDDADFAINGNLLGWIRHDADPAVCMGLIEELKVATRFYAVNGFWVATIYDHDPKDWISKTLAEAVARCVIAMRLGDEFEAPDELG
jgi:hypothetical protein